MIVPSACRMRPCAKKKIVEMNAKTNKFNVIKWFLFTISDSKYLLKLHKLGAPRSYETSQT